MRTNRPATPAADRARLHGVLAAGVVAAGYALALGGEAALLRYDVAGLLAWPAAGLGLAGLRWAGTRFWPALFVGALLALMAIPGGRAIGPEAVEIVFGTAGVVLAAVALQELAGGNRLAGLNEMLLFLGIGAGVVALASMVGFWAATAANGAPGGALTASKAVLSGFSAFNGVIVVTPLIESWLGGGAKLRRLQAAGILGVTAIVSWLVLAVPPGELWRPWPVLPFLMWPALALGLRGASMALAIATGCAFAGGLLHTVGTASAMSGIAPMIMVQQFIAVSGSTVLLLAAVDTERRARNADRLRLALEAARQGVFEMDAATSDLRLDAQARRLLGAPMEPAVLRWNEFLALLDPDDRTLAGSEALRAASSDGSGVLSVDLRVRAPDGPLRWVAMYGRTSFDGAGPGARPVTTTGTVRDITERKQVVARIQEREVFVRQVLDNLPMFVGVLTPDGMLVEMNRAAVDAAGLELDDVIGRKLWECHWWSYSPALQNKLRQAMGRVLTGEVVRFDAQMRMSGSTLTWVDFQLAPLYDDEGRLTHAIPSAIDLTARKRAEEARQRLTSIIEATPDFVGIADPQGHTIYVSPGGRRLVGLSALEPVEGTLLADWHPPDVAEMISTSVLPHAARSGVWEGQSALLKRDGTIIQVSQVVIAHRNGSGAIEQFSTIMRDQTEIVEAERRQSALLRELSHRVKNTLAVVQAIANQTLRAEPLADQSLAVFRSRIASLAASHALLTDMRWRGIELSDVVRCQVDQLDQGLRRRIDLAGPALRVPAETADNLGLIIHELAMNAASHGALSLPEGRATVAWRRDGDGRIVIEWIERGGPPIEGRPRQDGFGTRLIDRCGAHVERHFDREGLTVRLLFDLAVDEGDRVLREPPEPQSHVEPPSASRK